MEVYDGDAHTGFAFIDRLRGGIDYIPEENTSTFWVTTRTSTNQKPLNILIFICSGSGLLQKLPHGLQPVGRGEHAWSPRMVDLARGQALSIKEGIDLPFSSIVASILHGQ